MGAMILLFSAGQPIFLVIDSYSSLEILGLVLSDTTVYFVTCQCSAKKFTKSTVYTVMQKRADIGCGNADVLSSAKY